MKTSAMVMLLETSFCLIGALILAACGNGQTTINQAQKQQIDQLARFADSLQPQASWNFDFEKLPTGQTPLGWTPYFTGEGNTDWQISRDEKNQVLAQVYSENPGSHFNMVVNDSIQAKDLKLSVRLKGVGANTTKAAAWFGDLLTKTTTTSCGPTTWKTMWCSIKWKRANESTCHWSV